jgi:hypothetical protein
MFKHFPVDVLSILKLENNTNWGKSAFNSKVDVLLQNDNESKPELNTKEDFNKDLDNLKFVLFDDKDVTKKKKISNASNFVLNDTFLASQLQKESEKLIKNMGKTLEFKPEDRLSVLSILVCSRVKESKSDIKFFKNLPEIQSELDKVLYEYSLPPQGIFKLFVVTSHLFSF